MRSLLLSFLLCLGLSIHASRLQYQPEDSVRVVKMLKEVNRIKVCTNWVVHFARKLIGVPYVGKTLEVNDTERLIVNLRQLDCTTYVENVLALALCASNGLERFEDFYTFLRLIRYRSGKVSYTDRLHYFADWVADNERMGYVRNLNSFNPPFSAVQTVNAHFMTEHVKFYPMLVKHPEWIDDIKNMEKNITGWRVPYVPKAELENTSVFRDAIRDGDILGLLTSRDGLDTSHLGIAIWHKDGLHLLNASSLHHKVVEERMTLYQYMQKQPRQIGFRVVRPIMNE